jgi:hypothetical protein
VTVERPEWHAREEDLAGYVADTLTRAGAASVETHLLECAACRNLLGTLVGETDREQAWERLVTDLDRPASPGLDRLRLGRSLAASTLATPIMLMAAAVAVGLVGVVPLITAMVAGKAGLLMLLLLAPVAPMAAVALAYRDWVDPAGEISLAAPSAGLTVVALRALVVSLAAAPVALIALAVTQQSVGDVATRLAVAWCLPGLAMVGVVLFAGTTRFDPLTVAEALAAGWMISVMTFATARRSLRPENFLDVIATPTLQYTAFAIAVIALLLTVLRRDTYAYRRIQ